MTSIELRRLTKDIHGHTAEYKVAYESYYTMYNNIMSRGKNKQMSRFLGGNPVTLEKKDFEALIKKRFMVSAKADGLRFLLMIGNEKATEEGRSIYLIDKNMDFWIILIDGNQIPPVQKIAPIILDGELLIWGNITIRTKDLIKIIPIRGQNATKTTDII